MQQEPPDTITRRELRPTLDLERDWASDRRALLVGGRPSPPAPGAEVEEPLVGQQLERLAALSLSRRAAAIWADPEEPGTWCGFPALGPIHETFLREKGRRSSRPAGQRLASLLTGTERRSRIDLLLEWIRLTAEFGRSAPRESIPALLELGRDGRPGAEGELRAAIRQIVGPVGEWLARHHQDWAWVGEKVPVAASPSPLSVAEGTRRRGRLLARLGDSVRLLTGEGLPTRIEIDLSQAPEEGSSRRLWIERAMAQLPLSTWTERWGMSPSDLVAVAARSAERDLLLRAWTEAATHLSAADPQETGTAEWIESLLLARLGEPSEEGVELLPRLPMDLQEGLLLRAMALSHGVAVDQPAFWYLTRSTHPWSHRVSRRLIELLEQEIESRTVRVQWDWDAFLRRAALRFHPDILPEVTATFAGVTGFARSRSPLAPALATFLTDLQFRATMRQEILERETE
jgi:hypothetical protein